MNKHPVYIIQGAQWGSEGKGQIAAIYAQNLKASAVVRTGSINAGHTVYYNGQPYKMQLIPTAWVCEHKPALVLGPGCFIHRETLAWELSMIKAETGEDIRGRLFIDHRCTVHEPRHEVAAKASGRHYAIGSTSKGSSDAVIERITARSSPDRAQLLKFSHDPMAGSWDLRNCIHDTTRFLYDRLDDAPVVLEGTQGAHLDMFTGPYPFTTNRAVSTAAWLAYAGLPPTLDIRPILVARTFPIRVAGNSGPMPDETTWEQVYGSIAVRGNSAAPRVSMAAWMEYNQALRDIIHAGGGPDKPIPEWTPVERYGYQRLLSEAPTLALSKVSTDQRTQLLRFVEKTTVTHKIRRVAYFHIPTVLEAIRLNGCHEIWMTFLNYRFPQLWACTDRMEIRRTAGNWLALMQDELGERICGVTTGPLPEHHLTR